MVWLSSTFVSKYKSKSKKTFMKLILQKNYFKLLIAFIVMLTFSDAKAQVYYDLSAGNYAETFTSWITPTTGTNWSSVATSTVGTIPVATRTTVASSAFTTTTSGGVQNGTTNIQFLSTGATSNSSAVALDLNLNFTGRNAGNFSFDAATVFNGTGNRVASLKVYYSTDGTIWTELIGTNLPYIATNTVAGSALISLALPAALNNQPTVKLRFYNYNGTATGITGSRPKISIDNVAVTSTVGAATPTVTTLSASLITTTSAVLNGTINANTTTTIASFDYGTTLTYGNSISATPSSITGTTPTAISANLVSLNVNTLYNFRAVGADAAIFNGANASFYTLANVPNAALVDNPQLTTLNVTIDGVTQNGNPANTQYAIQEIGGNYVQANGSLGATTVWQTASVWGTKTVTGLNNNTAYTFRVKARNGSNVETAFGFNAQGTTLQNLSASVTVNAPLNSFGNLCIGSSAESSFTFDGTNLDGTPLVLNPVDGFTYSLNQITYTTSLNILYSGTTITAQQVWVRFSPTSVQSYNDFILISGGGLSTNVTVATIASGVNTPVIVNTGSVSLITASSATLSTSITLGCSSVTSYGFEFSTTNGFANGSGTTILNTNLASNAFSTNISGLNPSTTYYFKGFATDATGTIYSIQSSFITSAIPAPVANIANSITNTQFDANWTVVTEASNYRLDLSKFSTFTSSTPATDLFFSEYLEGSSNNKYVEIYNGTGAAVNLSNYELRLFANGATVASNAQILSGTLANGATIVYKNSLSTIYSGTTTTSTALNYNGNDALALWKVSTSSYVDIFGRIGENPGTAWTATGFSTLDKTLVRNANVTGGITINPSSGFPTLSSQWTQFNIDTISNLGSHTFNNVTPSFVIGYENLLVSGTSQLVTGLTENTNYYYRVRAQNASSTSLNSNVINVLTAISNPTFTNVSQASGIVCDGSLATFNVTGLLPNSTSTITYNINDGSTLTFTNLVANNSGIGSFTSILSASNNGQILTVLTIERTDLIAPSIVTLSFGNTSSLSVSSNVTYYVDADNDGFGDPAISVSNCIQPIGYILNNTDCNDNNALIYQSATLFIDLDSDNYNNGTQVVCYGATVPAGYSLTTLGLDCNDANASVFVNGTYYLDTDNDGFGAGSSVIFCVANAAVAPSGYSINNTDCDNTKATVYPGAPELCYDGLDNNCNGTIDEGCTPIVSTVQSTQCGVTLPLIDSDVFANNVSGAQGYRFRVTNMTTGLVQSIDKFLRVFKITQLPVYAFNTTYQVEVSVRINNVWQPFFGSPCMVSTPATTTQLQATQCGGTLTAMSDVIYANAVPFSTGYRFRVTNVLTSTQQILDRTIREFRMTLLTNPEFNTNYTVEVAIRNTNGVYLPYGNVCTITTPSFPTTQLQLTQCDYTALSSSEVLFADSYPGVTTYRFRLSNATLGYAFTVDRPTRTVTLSLFPGLVASTTYSAQVSVKINGVFGPFGKICGLTTPVTITTRDVVDGTNELSEVKGFKVVAYPNPFAENFKLNLSSSSDEKVQIRVYDMLGKLIEDKQVAATEIASVEVGVNYPSGVYNVVVSQASDTQTLRVIKR